MENDAVEELKPKPKTKQEMKREEKMREMLKIARELWFQSDGRDFSLRAVARGMKMPPSNLYNYFKDKRDLYFAMLNQEYFQEVIDTLKLIRGDTELDFYEKMQFMLKFIFNYALQDPPRYKLMFMTTAPEGKDSEKGKYEKEFTFYTGEIVYGIIAESLSMEGIPEKHPLLLYRYIASLVSGSIQMVTNMLSLDPDFDANQTLDYITNSFISHYRAYVSTLL